MSSKCALPPIEKEFPSTCKALWVYQDELFLGLNFVYKPIPLLYELPEYSKRPRPINPLDAGNTFAPIPAHKLVFENFIKSDNNARPLYLPSISEDSETPILPCPISKPPMLPDIALIMPSIVAFDAIIDPSCKTRKGAVFLFSFEAPAQKRTEEASVPSPVIPARIEPPDPASCTVPEVTIPRQ